MPRILKTRIILTHLTDLNLETIRKLTPHKNKKRSIIVCTPKQCKDLNRELNILSGDHEASDNGGVYSIFGFRVKTPKAKK